LAGFLLVGSALEPMVSSEPPSTSMPELLELVLDAQPSAADKAEFLRWHNILRCRSGANAVTWHDQVAEGAQSWSQNMKDQNNMYHSNSYQLSPPVGENLAWGYGTVESAMKAWFDEWEDCINDECTQKSGVVGHFTAMVWKGVTKIGCGRVDNWYTCRYYSGETLSGATANIQGHYGSNVEKPTKTEAECSDGSSPTPSPSPSPTRRRSSPTRRRATTPAPAPPSNGVCPHVSGSLFAVCPNFCNGYSANAAWAGNGMYIVTCNCSDGTVCVAEPRVNGANALLAIESTIDSTRDDGNIHFLQETTAHTAIDEAKTNSKFAGHVSAMVGANGRVH